MGGRRGGRAGRAVSGELSAALGPSSSLSLSCARTIQSGVGLRFDWQGFDLGLAGVVSGFYHGLTRDQTRV